MTVEELLPGAWTTVVGPHVRADACILAAKCSSDVLAYFGVKHLVRPVGALAFNDRAAQEMRAGREVPEWPSDAWSVGIQPENPGPGWSGHAVVLTDEHLIDLTAPQVDRPSKGIVVGGPLVVEHSKLVESTLIVGGLEVPIVEGRYVLTGGKGNPIPKSAPDWRRNPKHFSGPMIRWIRERMEER